TVDVAKFHLDFEELDKLIRIQNGLSLGDFAAAGESLSAWGHGANHAGAQGAQAYIPRFADYRRHEDWQASGGQSAASLAAGACLPEPRVLLDADRTAALDEYIRRRKDELLG